ncbi:nucleotide pyrophosphohydrolase [Tenuifilum thalassicum]|uniref:Nucleotide pyrophosphohydrolase n=1 Tax=Tenuifilum thalassicum TaxID=2590900 RepID=A0A7D4BTF6_9BACT|nr:nucleotide pyrophosphohydrolase [Tenuifilum thalassicum]QKG81141.1 nucleotide pyrophosphohydrolase [Tenuifilum thalassicum]
MTELTLNEAQKLVDEWIQTKGVRYFNELTNMTLLMEEVGELARIMARRYGEQSFKDGETDHDPTPEMADILFVLICLANQTGVNLNKALLESIEKKTKRDAERHLRNSKLL